MHLDGAWSDLTFTCGVCDENLVDKHLDVCNLCESDFQETLNSI